MKKYIRVCLSLDKETIEELKEISKDLKKSLSETVKILIWTNQGQQYPFLFAVRLVLTC